MAAVLAVAIPFPATCSAGQLSASAELQGAVYPRDPAPRPAIDSEARGWGSLEFENALSKTVDFKADAIVYASNHRDPLLDGQASVAWRGPNVTVAGGLLRERWGRFPDSALDPLGPPNTPFSLVTPELRLAQPAVRATVFVGGVSVDTYALVGHRTQPVPEHDGRFGFGVPTCDDVRRGGMADRALAARVAGTGANVDWAAHVFGGLSRRPTFVPRFTADAGLVAVDAVYTQVLQAGGELETTRADWRFLAEGFSRSGGLDVTGAERTYVSITGAAEYQRLGAFEGAYNLIPRFEVMVDSRGDRADIPFGSGARAAMRIAQTRRLPMQLDVAYTYDWAFRGHAFLGSVEKMLAESPNLNLGFRCVMFSKGEKPSVLDIWRNDLELVGYVRVGLSR